MKFTDAMLRRFKAACEAVSISNSGNVTAKVLDVIDARDEALERLERAQAVIDAAKFANWCPEQGGYRDGRSIEDCYERLHEALCAYYRIPEESPLREVPNATWMSEAELDRGISK